MMFLRLAYYGDSGWDFRVFEACLVWGNTETRTAGNEKEIGFEREIPNFPKPPAPALRFGSMNPISRVLGPWEHRGKLQRLESRLACEQKL